MGAGLALRGAVGACGLIPAADEVEQDHPGQRHGGEPFDRDLPTLQHDEGRRQGAKGRACVAADLKHRLGKAGPHPGSKAHDARGFGVEDRRAKADQRHRQKDKAKAGGMGQKDQPDPGGGHARRQRKGHGPLVGVKPDQGLQDRRRALKDKRDQSDLGEGQIKIVLQQRIARRDQRLHQVVQKVTKGHGKDHRGDGGFWTAGGGGLGRHCGPCNCRWAAPWPPIRESSMAGRRLFVGGFLAEMLDQQVIEYGAVLVAF